MTTSLKKKDQPLNGKKKESKPTVKRTLFEWSIILAKGIKTKRKRELRKTVKAKEKGMRKR
jgi:hypothetical protein